MNLTSWKSYGNCKFIILFSIFHALFSGNLWNQKQYQWQQQRKRCHSIFSSCDRSKYQLWFLKKRFNVAFLPLSSSGVGQKHLKFKIKYSSYELVCSFISDSDLWHKPDVDQHMKDYLVSKSTHKYYGEKKSPRRKQLYSSYPASFLISDRWLAQTIVPHLSKNF